MAGRQANFGRRNEATQARGQAIDLESDTVELLDESEGDRESDWTRDVSSIVLLLVLYTLQGIPMGLSGSIPFLLLEKVTRLPGTLSACIVGRIS